MTTMHVLTQNTISAARFLTTIRRLQMLQDAPSQLYNNTQYVTKKNISWWIGKGREDGDEQNTTFGEISDSCQKVTWGKLLLRRVLEIAENNNEVW